MGWLINTYSMSQRWSWWGKPKENRIFIRNGGQTAPSRQLKTHANSENSQEIKTQIGPHQKPKRNLEGEKKKPSNFREKAHSIARTPPLSNCKLGGWQGWVESSGSFVSTFILIAFMRLWGYLIWSWDNWCLIFMCVSDRCEGRPEQGMDCTYTQSCGKCS